MHRYVQKNILFFILNIIWLKKIHFTFGINSEVIFLTWSIIFIFEIAVVVFTRYVISKH